ncbi:hypothetical protein KSC_035750 [Ktedonobacter sp. SOSP1-52]|nr:hypothetical protein KSC_035750 [Ktedonobacter sp. SOSP1-52]
MAHLHSLVPAPGLIVPIEGAQIVPTGDARPRSLAVKRVHLSVDSNPGYLPG